MRILKILSVAVFSLAADAAVLRVEVDASGAARKLIHSKVTIPVAPGEFKIAFPKWIQGEHAPSGPISEVVDLQIKAGATLVRWTRDALDMHVLKLQVPSGASEVELDFNYVLPAAGAGFSSAVSTSPHIVCLNWYQVLFAPLGQPSSNIQVRASLRVPAGWKFGTALEISRQSADQIDFKETDLATLADSPVITGDHFRTIEFTKSPLQVLHVAADSAEALKFRPETEKQLAAVPEQLFKLFGARPFREYHFLLGLSDHLTPFGLEHHQSSENHFHERTFVDPDLQNIFSFILAHEMTHAWNGKYRRPAGITAPDYQKPLDTELLWVYEGLTDYLGFVIATRAGLFTPEIYRSWLALDLAVMSSRGGRAWRPVSDTAVAAQLLYGGAAGGTSRRRAVDFYPEGGFFWMEADTIIRQKSNGAKSLDDFCQKFHGGQNGSPTVKPYDLNEVISTLNDVVANDWKSLIQKRIYDIAVEPPINGIENSGWRLTYTNAPTAFLETYDGARKQLDVTFSIGLFMDPDGTIRDVLPNSAADRAGMSHGLKIIAINQRKWTDKLLRQVLESSEPLEIICEDADFIRTFKMDYRQGPKYPILERIDGKPDLLSKIIEPRP